MEQNKVQATTGITFRILVALSICHCLNDTLQSVISAVYPLFKEDLGLSFAQIDNACLPVGCIRMSAVDWTFF